MNNRAENTQEGSKDDNHPANSRRIPHPVRVYRNAASRSAALTAALKPPTGEECDYLGPTARRTAQ
ncbi:Uncharacterised protein [Mycobacteroides abscessus subsp. bolletii]|nr:Uncharacterised protein [Mycobacteroides abscessus subsp. bolletii]SHT17146.1 Uncharacterised protein [Mycobacteroides abscessus subsp. bolletii]SKG05674.1 Uncharacterised protein [Mycobacteroides abscessus subsp. bolletii]SKG72421.1 Uncharacterised protein [Mycobacteroides abscessus subsp. bolletii]SKJ19457.1 Uncharacterised protein [Mycobacteroides abscessus subsp. bolletii]